MLTEHPTPWTLHWQDDHGAILDAGNRQVLGFRAAHPDEPGWVRYHDLYELIVRCVNAHRDLVAACNAAAALCENIGLGVRNTEAATPFVRQRLDAALAKAKP